MKGMNFSMAKIKLLIADDEPLVRVGVQSMLNWGEMGIEICGAAKDGVEALEMIEKYLPQIVIADIKMPKMDGLELIRICRKRYGKLPAFIILTSYEEFQLLKEAMNNQVIEYLIKLELNEEILTAAVKKALLAVEELDKSIPLVSSPSYAGAQYFYDKFFVKLLYNVFESEEQFNLQAKELNLVFRADFYAVSLCKIVEFNSGNLDNNDLFSLYTSTVQTVNGIVKKYIPCHVVSLDIKHFAIIFQIDKKDQKKYSSIIYSILNKTFSMVHNYFNVTILSSTGRLYPNPHMIFNSYQDARQAFNYVSKDKNIVFFEDIHYYPSNKDNFNISSFKSVIAKAFEEFDDKTLFREINHIIEIFHDRPAEYLQFMDIACNILYLSLSLLPDGDKIINEIFHNNPDGYRSIYKQVNTNQVSEWLMQLRDGLCKVLNEKNKDYKNRIVSNAKKYIELHINEKLTLSQVATALSISPNYLSQLFKKYCNIGFSEYVNQMKIAKAKTLLDESNLKVYEVAEKLGFENAFYFSKVFKKIEGCSPKEYQMNKPSTENNN